MGDAETGHTLTPAQCLTSLTSERLLLTLLTGAFLKHTTNALKDSVEFWTVVLPYCNAYCDNCVNMLDALRQNFSKEELQFYARYLDGALQTVSSLSGEIAGIQLEISTGHKIAAKSVLGVIARDVAFCFATLDFSPQLQLWTRLRGLVGPFVAEIHTPVESEASELRAILSKAVLPAARVPKPRPPLESDTLDISGFRAAIHYDCDIGINGDDDLNVLADMFAKQGQISAALEAVNEAFVRDRRSLIREMRSGDTKTQARRSQTLREGSARKSRELVGYLQTLLCVHGRPTSPPPPPALDVPIQQLTQYVVSTSVSEEEKAEAMLLELEAEIVMGNMEPHVLQSLIGSKHMLTTLFRSSQNDIIGPFLLVSAHIWLSFGLIVHARNSCRLVHKTLASEARPALRSQLAQTKALYLDEPLEGLVDLATFPSSDWCDFTQGSYTLIMAWALTLAHDLETAKLVLDQLDGAPLPLRISEGNIQARILLLLYESNYYAAFAMAQQRAQHHAAKGAGYQELVYTTFSIRCLVLSQRRLHAAQAQILLDEALKRALETSKLGLVFELTVLQARLLYNNGDMKGCYDLCRSLKQLVNVAATIRLRCEWKLLSFASSCRLNVPASVLPDQTELVRSLYTEFNEDISRIARDAKLSLLHHTHKRGPHSHGPQLRGPQPHNAHGTNEHNRILSLTIQKVFARSSTEAIPVEPELGNELVYLAYLRASAASEGFVASIYHARDVSTPHLSSSSGEDYSIAAKRPLPLNGSPQRRGSKRRSMSIGTPELP